LCIFFLSLCGLLSCGLEKSYYMHYIGRIDYTDTSAIIRLPSDSEEGYRGIGLDGIQFDSFIIFYRIYISESNASTGRQLESDSNLRSAISTALNSDYNALYSFTDITSTNASISSNLENTFSNRRFFLLTLVNSDGKTVELGSSSLGKRLTIAFPTNEDPTLTIDGGATYDLRRAVKNENLNLYDLTPLPLDRKFLNHSDLYNTVNITNGRNADVATGPETSRYTYVSLYIAARGTNIEMPPGTVYSQPTFIGIFLLAESGG